MTRLFTLCLFLASLGWGAPGAVAADDLLLPLEQGGLVWSGNADGGEPGLDSEPAAPPPGGAAFASQFTRQPDWTRETCAPAAVAADAHQIRAPPSPASIA